LERKKEQMNKPEMLQVSHMTSQALERGSVAWLLSHKIDSPPTAQAVLGGTDTHKEVLVQTEQEGELVGPLTFALTLLGWAMEEEDPTQETAKKTQG
jgi:hypothetical protein